MKTTLETELNVDIIEKLCYTNDFMWQYDEQSTCVGAHITNPWSYCDPEYFVCAGYLTGPNAFGTIEEQAKLLKEAIKVKY